MMKGTVKFYNRNKDFGFIHGEDGADYYFNSSRMLAPNEDDQVSFNGFKNQQGDQAKAVKIYASSGPSKRRLLIVCGVIAVLAFAAGYFVSYL